MIETARGPDRRHGPGAGMRRGLPDALARFPSANERRAETAGPLAMCAGAQRSSGRSLKPFRPRARKARK